MANRPVGREKKVSGKNTGDVYKRGEGLGTGPVSGGSMPPEERVEFVLDRPFLFAIAGPDSLPLFTGIVNRPV